MSEKNRKRIILDLCGGTGAWSKPYADAGYDVRVITKLPYGSCNVCELLAEPDLCVHGILAAPPCTEFSGSGARWWKRKGPIPLRNALAIVDACLRQVVIHHNHLRFWCLENPVGRLKYWLGPPVMYFNPCDYGDPYTKKTALWGNFNFPIKNFVEPIEGSKMHKLPPSADRATLRSITPPGFAKAFFKANP